MSELRKDPIVERWVIIAPERPLPSPHRSSPELAGPCPFCPGNERFTPPEIAAVRKAGSPPNGPGWSLRVVPNRLAALHVEGQLDHRDGLFEREAGIGAHEIVIETPEHDRDFADLSVDELTAVLTMWSERLRDLSGDLRLIAPLAFRHRGREAGATVPHAHSQLLVLPVVPLDLRMELDASEAVFNERGYCVWCETISAEQNEGARYLFGNGSAVAICPWASRVPFEVQILPLTHASSFEREPKETLRAIAEVLRESLRRIDSALDRPACSIALRTAPLRSDDLPGFHWRIEVLPILENVAGMMASGCWINPVPPEESAAVLKRLEAK